MSASDFHYKAGGELLGYIRAGRGRSLPWPLVATLLAVADALAIAALATAIGHAYYIVTYNDPTNLDTHVRLGATMALLLVAACTMMGGYRLAPLVRQPFQPGRLASAFLFGLMILIAMLFLTKSSHAYSRSVVSISFALGLPLILMLRYAEVRLLRRLSEAGRLDTQRLMLIGPSDRIDEIAGDRTLGRLGIEVVSRMALALRPDDPAFEQELARIAETARAVDPDGVVLCLPWAEREALEACVARLAELPAAIYLDGDPYLRSLSASQSGPFDNPIGFQIIGRPFSQAHLVAKRAFDLAAASTAQARAAPVLALVALLVRLDSPGPVLFSQQRYGYGRTPFRIYKFRTMRHEKDARFRQAERGDQRVTRIGAFLRRTNLDELPQLFNVIAGDMSLVGPRPHPLELDDQFSPLIAHYSRRHRVRPGITGWAQVNGFRGETDTTEKMRGRLAFDLHYLNNWSFWLDLRILLMTVASATAYRNAF